MGRIDDELANGEEVLARRRIHPVGAYGPAATFFIIFLVGGIIMAGAGDPVAVLGMAGLGLVVAAPFALAGYVKVRTTEIALTDRRVLARTGLLSTATFQTSIPKIESLAVRQTPLGRIAGYGTVLVVGTGGTKFNVDQIEDPYEFRRTVEGQIDRVNGSPTSP